MSSFDVSLRLLARAGKSEYELREYLKTKGYPEEETEDTVSRLLSKGYLNDERYAESVVRRLKASGKGYYAIKRTLDMKKLPCTALDDFEPDEKALERQLIKYIRGDFSEKRLMNAVAAMQRRGFRLGEIKNALERIKNEEENG